MRSSSAASSRLAQVLVDPAIIRLLANDVP
jgi:hypothetical protein